jgi:uncharacterized protein with NAD-binding domain and iron-sulfur cluster
MNVQEKEVFIKGMQSYFLAGRMKSSTTYYSMAIIGVVSVSSSSLWQPSNALVVESSSQRRRIITTQKKKVCIIGGGWAGFSVADSLANVTLPGDTNTNNAKEDNLAFEIDLLDASPRGPGGLAGGWTSGKLNRTVEAGIHGFWREYRNTFAAIEGIGLNLDDVLTEYTPSLLISESGRVALAPVLGTDLSVSDDVSAKMGSFSLKDLDLNDPTKIIDKLADLLPPPLDVALLSDFNDDNPLTVADRISAIGLLGVWADFEQEDPESWKRYDKISADNLFRVVAGVSPRLYQELVSPLLHVLPMTPGYDCSAAAALSCFHVFALQARGAFDVRWCRGTISDKIFNPWAEKLQHGGNVNIKGSSKVTSIFEEMDPESKSTKFSVTVNGNESTDYDAVIFAVGGTAMKRLLPSCPPLAKLPVASEWQKIRGVTCLALRLFLKPFIQDDGSLILPRGLEKATKDSPVVVCGPRIGSIPDLTETGFCIYDLRRMQDELKHADDALALEVDLFRANNLADRSDDEILKVVLNAVSTALECEELELDDVIDFSVVRAKDAVSHFCIDSASWSPQVKLDERLFICGDWIDRTGHSSWSTEKSVVTGRQAANQLCSDLGLRCEATVVPAAEDTPQLASLRKVGRLFRRLSPDSFLPPSPWVFAKQLSGGRL